MSGPKSEKRKKDVFSSFSIKVKKIIGAERIV